MRVSRQQEKSLDSIREYPRALREQSLMPAT